MSKQAKSVHPVEAGQSSNNMSCGTFEGSESYGNSQEGREGSRGSQRWPPGAVPFKRPDGGEGENHPDVLGGDVGHKGVCAKVLKWKHTCLF